MILMKKDIIHQENLSVMVWPKVYFNIYRTAANYSTASVTELRKISIFLNFSRISFK